MHDVLDPRDLVPDEAEQLRLSGYPVGGLEERARAAAAQADLEELARVSAELATLERDPGWHYEEPEDDATLLAGLAGSPRLRVPRDRIADRIAGAWLGRTVGNTLGKPVEGLSRPQVELYLRAAGHWPITGYLPLLEPLPEGVPWLHPSAPLATAGRFTDVPRDDDLDWTILGLHVLESHGRGVSTEQVAAEWLDRVPFTQTFTAERAAYRNLARGIVPPRTAVVDNPYREWIGALIRGDVFGYASPGDLAEAARLALVDARLSHTANGTYGEMWAAALTAAALCVDTAEEALRRASDVVPPGSRLAEVLAMVLAQRSAGASAPEVLDRVDADLGRYPWVHTLPNAALISVGLLWGRSFTEAVGTTLAGGRDTDSNAATVGSVHGALHGVAGVPADLVGTTHVRVRSAVRDHDRVRIDELAARTLALVPA